jgi:hypothetical protein
MVRLVADKVPLAGVAAWAAVAQLATASKPQRRNREDSINFSLKKRFVCQYFDNWTRT